MKRRYREIIIYCTSLVPLLYIERQTRGFEMDEKSSTEKITIRLPKAHLRSIDRMVEKAYYGSRAEAIRIAVRDLVLNEIPTITGKVEKWETLENREEMKELAGKKYMEP